MSVKPPPMLKRNVSKLDINATRHECCHKCGESIRGSWIICKMHKYHNRCFTCAGCKIEIGTSEFKTHNNEVWCPTCYTEYCAPRCVTCDKPVEGQSIVVLDMAMHPECFRCEMCQNTLVSFREAETTDSDKVLIVCGDCYDKIENIKEPEKGECFGCGLLIGEDEAPWNWEGKQFHPSCFVCEKCETQLGPDNIPYNLDGKPHCESCITQPNEVFLCNSCEKELGPDNPVVLVDDVSFCKSCHQRFLEEEKKKKCSECGKKLGSEDRDSAGRGLQVSANSPHLCKACFSHHLCTNCHKVLGEADANSNGEPLLLNGDKLCRPCFRGAVCQLCAKQLTVDDSNNGRGYYVGEDTACKACFNKNTCHNCKAVLKESDFDPSLGQETARLVDGWRYCAKCHSVVEEAIRRAEEEDKKHKCHECHAMLTEEDRTHGLPYQLGGCNYCKPCYLAHTCHKCETKLQDTDVDSDGQPLEVDGDRFCADCYRESVCSLCQNNLGPKDIGPHGLFRIGKEVVCRLCYSDGTCAACRAELSENDKENGQNLLIQGKKVCRNCFTLAERKRIASVCAKCSTELGPDDYILGKPRQVDGLNYCRDCHSKVNDVPMCSHCRKPIKDVMVQARGKAYHRECVHCAYCDCNLVATGDDSGNIRIDEEGHPCCEKCYKKNHDLGTWGDTGQARTGDGFLQIRIKKAMDLYKDNNAAKEAYIVFKLGLQMIYSAKRTVAKAERETKWDQFWEFRKIDISDTAFELGLMWRQKTMGKTRIFLKDLVAGISSKQFHMECGELIVEFTWRPHSAATRNEAFLR